MYHILYVTFAPIHQVITTEDVVHMDHVLENAKFAITQRRHHLGSVPIVEYHHVIITDNVVQ